ncbi:hypothetical protein FH972_022422 [Carpinus fangiana]|uniref:DASH complex subunit DAD3 n=1 Tax=Carpinus fangiana TaxID=176857 RepID=A0A5N6KS72_9ROSI|nr:hypothetical protein FH972_022422 [Carpinus fangiana]
MSSSPPSSPPQGPSSPRDPDDIPDYASDPRLSPLEASVLTEYARLKQNLDALSASLADLASQPSAGVSDGLRALERKTGLVCTALKASVYGLLLQQGIEGGEEGDETVCKSAHSKDSTDRLRPSSWKRMTYLATTTQKECLSGGQPDVRPREWQHGSSRPKSPILSV